MCLKTQQYSYVDLSAEGNVCLLLAAYNKVRDQLKNQVSIY